MNALRPYFFKAVPSPRGALALFAATFFLTIFGSHPAHAAASLGEVMCTVADQMAPFLEVFNMIAYIAGAVFIIQGLVHWRNHHEVGHHQYPHHKTFSLIVAGTLLVALPSFIGMLIDTLFTGGGDGGSDGATAAIGACVDMMPSTGGSTTTGATLDMMLINLVKNIQFPLTALTSIIAIVLGLFLIMRGLIKASRYGTDPRQHSIPAILNNIVIGTLLVVIGQTVPMMLASVFGDSSISDFSSLSWANFGDVGANANFQNAVKAAMTFVQLIGFISFVRGWNIIRHAVEGSGQATVPQGITHIVGGVLAINIYMFVKIVDITFGTGFFSA